MYWYYVFGRIRFSPAEKCSYGCRQSYDKSELPPTPLTLPLTLRVCIPRSHILSQPPCMYAKRVAGGAGGGSKWGVVRAEISKGNLHDIHDHCGATPLHMAMLYGHHDMAKALVRAYPSSVCDPFTAGSESGSKGGNSYTGETALHIAVVQKSMDMVRLLLASNGGKHRKEQLLSRAKGKFFTPFHFQDWENVDLSKCPAWNDPVAIADYGKSKVGDTEICLHTSYLRSTVVL